MGELGRVAIPTGEVPRMRTWVRHRERLGEGEIVGRARVQPSNAVIDEIAGSKHGCLVAPSAYSATQLKIVGIARTCLRVTFGACRHIYIVRRVHTVRFGARWRRSEDVVTSGSDYSGIRSRSSRHSGQTGIPSWSWNGTKNTPHMARTAWPSMLLSARFFRCA
jgi:hypothetical protein